MGFVSYEFEARLALAEIEMRSGRTSIARAHLQDLEKETAAKGLGCIAHQVTEMLSQTDLHAMK
jgi:hypothetical protein